MVPFLLKEKNIYAKARLLPEWLGLCHLPGSIFHRYGDIYLHLVYDFGFIVRVQDAENSHAVVFAGIQVLQELALFDFVANRDNLRLIQGLPGVIPDQVHLDRGGVGFRVLNQQVGFSVPTLQIDVGVHEHISHAGGYGRIDLFLEVGGLIPVDLAQEDISIALLLPAAVEQQQEQQDDYADDDVAELLALLGLQVARRILAFEIQV